MSACNKVLLSEKDCTLKCHSHQHADLILKSATKGSPAEIRAFCNWLCHNFTTVCDIWGRNLLHIAASCGKWQIVKWLLNHCHCEVDIRDAESGWSALHRSCFYGQLTATKILLQNGANIRMTDHEGLTPLDLIIADRLPYVEYNKTYPQDVYVWGSNINYNLGLGNGQSKSNAESLDFFCKNNIYIKKVIICKFHTIFLSNDGRPFTCGHGHGGRLGQGTEVTQLVPSPVHGLGNLQCTEIAAGQDHLILLMEGNQIWTCGLNTYHQLGHVPPPECLFTPRPINLKFLKGKQILGVCAARFHSVFYTKDSVFTFGLNAGQLGHLKGDRTQILPRQASGVYHKDSFITEVAVSDGATVCATNQGDVYVLHEFQHRKIASKQIGIQKLSVVGGHLDSSCDAAGIREGGGLELRIILLMQSGKLYLWRQTNPYLRQCIFTSIQQLSVMDVCLNHFSIAMVSEKNQCFIGMILPYKNNKKISTSPQGLIKTQNPCGFVDRDECYSIRAKQLPYLYRATAVTSDYKGKNFAVLQASPKMGLLELPIISEAKLHKDMLQFLNETCIDDPFQDVVINVGQRQFGAHKYILGYRSDYFRKQFLNSNLPEITLENIKPEVFEQILKFIYSNTCDFLVDGFEINWKENNSSFIFYSEKEDLSRKMNKKKKNKIKELNDPLKCIQEASRRFSLQALAKSLENVQIINGRIEIKYENQLPKLQFDHQKLSEFCDVNLKSSDGDVFSCHRCILAARSEYFYSMLGISWIEKTKFTALNLPMSSRVLNILLCYLYTDSVTCLNALDNPDLICDILVIADQLLLIRLKEICEMSLVSLLTLKNACEFLQLAFIYNAEQLKKSCIEFVCINLPSILELKGLDILSDDVLEELTKQYRMMIPSMRRRFIVDNSINPTTELLKEVQTNFPINDDYDVEKQEIFKVENRSKTKRRTSHKSNDKKTVTPIKENDIEEMKDTVLKTEKQIDIQELPSTTQLNKEPTGQNMPPPIYDFIPLENAMIKLSSNESSRIKLKKIERMSQKQKKLSASHQKDSSNNQKLSPVISPWGNDIKEIKTSFWDSVDKNISSSKSGSASLNQKNAIHQQSEQSFKDIQKAEEQLQLSHFMAKIKPLDLINIEDQAIEELLDFYKAKDNPDEKISVSRVLPEKVANPVWKKHA